MSSDFAEYVCSLGPSGEPPDPESFAALLAILRGALAHEMKRRGLWSAPPRFLGVVGGSDWTHGDLLEDLLLDCYQFIFLRRLPGLRKQLLVRPNIDGLVFLNIRHFLHDAQRRHDPLGYRVFEVVHAAVVGLLGDGQLHVLAGDVKVRNETVLAFAPWHDPREAEGVDLRRQTAAWNDALLPQLITAWSRDEVVPELATRIAELPDDGVEVFRFRDLIEPLKDDARARWSALLLSAEGETAREGEGGKPPSIVRMVRPEHGFEERQGFAQLVDCVEDGLDRIGKRHLTREYLRRLWLFLRSWAAEADEASPRPATVEGDRPPSDKTLSKALGIPRGRIPGLRATLGELIAACRGEAAESAAPKAAAQAKSGSVPKRLQPSFAHQGVPAIMDLERRREQLRRKTGEVAAATKGVARAEAPDASPQPGETFVCVATRALPVEWLVVSKDPADPRRVLVVAVDDFPLVGSRDVEVAGAGGTAVRVRCDRARWVDAAVFDPAMRTGILDADTLERVRDRRAKIAAGTLRALGSARAADEDSEYVLWMERLDEARLALPERLAPIARIADWRRRPSVARASWDRRLVLAAAAVFAVATVGLGLWVGHLRHQVAYWSRPVVLDPTQAALVRFLDTQRSAEPLRVPAAATHVPLDVVLPRIAPTSAYRVQLVEADSGRVVWEHTTDSGISRLVVALPGILLTKELYLLRLHSRRATGEEELVDEQYVPIEREE